jgi:hypothetical protein
VFVCNEIGRPLGRPISFARSIRTTRRHRPDRRLDAWIHLEHRPANSVPRVRLGAYISISYRNEKPGERQTRRAIQNNETALGKMTTISDRVAAQAISDAKMRFPKISADGVCVGVRGARVQPIVPNQVGAAMEFLSQLTSTRTPRTSSYQLKHVGEDWGKCYGLCRYISNGAMIVSALALGLPVEAAGKPWELFNPNCLIGVSAISVRNMISANECARQEKQRGGVIRASNPISGLLCQSG